MWRGKVLYAPISGPRARIHMPSSGNPTDDCNLEALAEGEESGSDRSTHEFVHEMGKDFP